MRAAVSSPLPSAPPAAGIAPSSASYRAMKPPEPVLDQCSESIKAGMAIAWGAPAPASAWAWALDDEDSSRPLGRPMLTMSPSATTCRSPA